MQYVTTTKMFTSGIGVAKEQLKTYIKQLNAVSDKPSVNVRIQQVNDVIEAYFEGTGQRPDAYELYSLGSYLLDDYLTDQYKHARIGEYPFKTDGRVRKNHARNKTVFLGDRADI